MTSRPFDRQVAPPVAGSPSDPVALVRAWIPEATSRTRRALVVDDCDDVRMLGRILVTALGFEADLAANGAEAFRLFSQRSYDFVLMDCQMPVCDGFEATRDIRSLEKSRGARQTPVFAVSAEPGNAYSPSLSTCGATSFLAKPLRLDVLRRELQRSLPAAARS